MIKRPKPTITYIRKKENKLQLSCIDMIRTYDLTKVHRHRHTSLPILKIIIIIIIIIIRWGTGPIGTKNAH